MRKTDRGISRLVSAKSRESLETVIKQEEAWWLTERTWLERTDERRNDRLFLTRRAWSAVCARERDGECPKLRWCQWTRPCEESAEASSSAIPTISGSCLSHGTETNFMTLRKRRDARTRPQVDNAKRDWFLEWFFQNFSILYDYIRWQNTLSHDCIAYRYAGYLQYCFDFN